MNATTSQPNSSPRSSELAAKRNPFLSDPELAAMLSELHTMTVAPNSTSQFEQWQGRFLERLESVLDPKGTVEAARVHRSVVEAMTEFQTTLDRVLRCGRLETSPLGVKAQNAVNMLKEGCLDVEERLRELLMDHDKFQMAAVLVRDNFGLFGLLQSHETALQTIQDAIHEDAVDKQVLAAMNAYQNRMASFGDITAYLGLEEVMLKTLEFEILAEEDTTTIPEVSKHDVEEDELEEASISETEAETTCSEDNYSHHSSFLQDDSLSDMSPEEQAELAELERLIALEEASILEEERLTRQFEEELERLEAEEREAALREEAARQARIRAMKEKVAAVKLQIQAILDRREKERQRKQQKAEQQQRTKRRSSMDWAAKPAWRQQQDKELAAAKELREQEQRQKQEAAKARAEEQRKGRMAALRESRKAKMAALKKEEEEMRQGVRANVSTSARDLMTKVRAQAHDDLEQDAVPIPMKSKKKGLPAKSKSVPTDDARAAIAKARAAKARRKSRRLSKEIPTSA